MRPLFYLNRGHWLISFVVLALLMNCAAHCDQFALALSSAMQAWALLRSSHFESCNQAGDLLRQFTRPVRFQSDM